MIQVVFSAPKDADLDLLTRAISETVTGGPTDNIDGLTVQVVKNENVNAVLFNVGKVISEDTKNISITLSMTAEDYNNIIAKITSTADVVNTEPLHVDPQTNLVQEEMPEEDSVIEEDVDVDTLDENVAQ